MSYKWKVSVPSSQGLYERILSSSDTVVQHLLDSIGEDNFDTFLLLGICWTALICDSPLELKPFRVINKFVNSFLNNPLETIKLYSDLAHALERSLDDSDGESIIINRLHSEFAGTPIFREYCAFINDHNPTLLRFILSFCHFGKKVAYVNEELNAVALRQWHEVEAGLSALELPSWIVNLREVMAVITDGWDSNTFVFLPRHGSGSVAERGVAGSEAKNENFSLSPSLEYMYFTRKLNDIDWDSSLGPLPLNTDRRDSCKTSRLMFVPKTWKTSRSICMEPIAYQWAQQGVRKWYEHQLSDGLLRHHVVLKDQGANQEMARLGSFNHSIDTIDLSSASDSVAWELVRSIFTPSVLKHLAATRTSRIELPDGTIHEAAKYAPMGSALCFPVQSTIYSAVVAMASISYTYSLDWKKPGAFDGLDLKLAWQHAMGDGRLGSKIVSGLVPFRCYGDDITCDKHVTSNVIDALEGLGFTVNVDKSFIGTASFRESCGKSFHNGHDVTPIRFKTASLSNRITADTLAGVIDLANRAYDYGYSNLRRHVIQYALHANIQGVWGTARKANPILFVHEDDVDSSMAVRCLTPRNTHLAYRPPDYSITEESNSRYQRGEFRSITSGPRSVKKLTHKYDNYHYWAWWRSRYQDSGEVGLYDYFTRSGIPLAGPLDELLEAESSTILTDDVLRTGTKWRWTPA